MDILVIGGTRFFGIPMVERLTEHGHEVTIATRGNAPDSFGDRVSRIKLDRTDPDSVKAALSGRCFDVIIDKVAYCSNDVKNLLDNVKCGKYVLMSTSSVYENIGRDTAEEAFGPTAYPLRWCGRADGDYGEVKRQAECAAAQAYPEQKSLFVRYPVVIGENDYTGRLRRYAENIASGRPMFIDDLNSRISFIHEQDAADFLVFAAENDICGAVNGCGAGDVSVGEIVSYLERELGKKAVLSEDGEAMPYNGYPAFATLSTEKARSFGYGFGDIKKAFSIVLKSQICEFL